MQPSDERPVIKRPDFTEAMEPSYDYRNFENAGKFRGVGQAGKVGLKNGGGIDAMPPNKEKTRVRRDHEG